MYEDNNDSYVKEKINFEVWKKILKIIVKKKKSIVILIISVLVQSTVDVLYPLLNQYALKAFFEKEDLRLEEFDEEIFGTLVHKAIIGEVKDNGEKILM